MDDKAKKILFETYWTNKGGWIFPLENRKTDPEDFEYAKSKGLMFDNLTISHDQCVSEIVKIVNNMPTEKSLNAFLSSLSNRRLDWRSGIASYCQAKKLSEHKYSKVVVERVSGRPIYGCGTCLREIHSGWVEEKYIDEDLNSLNFERIKWGGLVHGRLIYILLDLRLLDAEIITEPTSEDIKIFRCIIDILDQNKTGNYHGRLEQKLQGILESNKDERQVLLDIMGHIEILVPKKWDVEYFSGRYEFNKEKVEFYFGKYL